MTRRSYEEHDIQCAMREKIDRCVYKDPNSGCWIWLKSQIRGYGFVMIRGKRHNRVPKLAYELYKGPVPVGKHVLHRCDCTFCCNPDHLFIGTHKENMNDMVRKDRQAKGEAHGKSKVTAEIVAAIRCDPRTGNRAIARSYGLSDGCVQSIKNRRTWKHIP